MSLDNVLAIAAAAEGAAANHRMLLVVLGLLISIPLIVAGSQIVLKLMERFPHLITAGAMLLGWVAGEMAVTDTALSPFIAQTDGVRYAFGVGAGLFVIIVARYLSSLKRSHSR